MAKKGSVVKKAIDPSNLVRFLKHVYSGVMIKCGGKAIEMTAVNRPRQYQHGFPVLQQVRSRQNHCLK